MYSKQNNLQHTTFCFVLQLIPNHPNFEFFDKKPKQRNEKQKNKQTSKHIKNVQGLKTFG